MVVYKIKIDKKAWISTIDSLGDCMCKNSKNAHIFKTKEEAEKYISDIKQKTKVESVSFDIYAN